MQVDNSLKPRCWKRAAASKLVVVFVWGMAEGKGGGAEFLNEVTKNSPIELGFMDISWLVGGDWLPFFIFPYIGLLIIPIDFHIFQRGGPTTNQWYIELVWWGWQPRAPPCRLRYLEFSLVWLMKESCFLWVERTHHLVDSVVRGPGKENFWMTTASWEGWRQSAYCITFQAQKKQVLRPEDTKSSYPKIRSHLIRREEVGEAWTWDSIFRGGNPVGLFGLGFHVPGSISMISPLLQSTFILGKRENNFIFHMENR